MCESHPQLMNGSIAVLRIGLAAFIGYASQISRGIGHCVKSLRKDFSERQDVIRSLGGSQCVTLVEPHVNKLEILDVLGEDDSLRPERKVNDMNV